MGSLFVIIVFGETLVGAHLIYGVLRRYRQLTRLSVKTGVHSWYIVQYGAHYNTAAAVECTYSRHTISPAAPRRVQGNAALQPQQTQTINYPPHELTGPVTTSLLLLTATLCLNTVVENVLQSQVLHARSQQDHFGEIHRYTVQRFTF